MMGYGYDPFLSERSLKPPVFHTSTFVFKSARDGKEFFELAYGLREKRPNEEPGLIYSMINNPDLEMLEDRLTIWDEAEASLVFASGMAAISTTLWSHVRPGTVLLHSDPVYGGTDFLLKKILPQFGVTSVGFPAEGGVAALVAAAEQAQSIGTVAVLYIETPANPTNGLVDLAAAREVADKMRNRRPAIIVDNTMLGPLYQTPWIPERSATRLREADLNVLSKLGKQGLEWRLEPEAFAGREVGREDDLLDFLVGCPVDIEVAWQPSA
jgi:methionine-gamma-lyase